MGKTAEFLPGTLDMLILKILSRAPNHGYGIAQQIEQASEDALRIGEGSLYPALQRLLVQQWVTAEWTQSEKNRKVRLYRITPAGRKRLVEEVRTYDFTIAAIARVMESV